MCPDEKERLEEPDEKERLEEPDEKERLEEPDEKERLEEPDEKERLGVDVPAFLEDEGLVTVVLVELWRVGVPTVCSDLDLFVIVVLCPCRSD